MTARLIARVLSNLDYLGLKKKSQESHLGLVQRSPVLGDRMRGAVFPLNISSLAFKGEEKSHRIFS